MSCEWFRPWSCVWFSQIGVGCWGAFIRWFIRSIVSNQFKFNFKLLWITIVGFREIIWLASIMLVCIAIYLFCQSRSNLYVWCYVFVIECLPLHVKVCDAVGDIMNIFVGIIFQCQCTMSIKPSLFVWNHCYRIKRIFWCCWHTQWCYQHEHK